MCLIPSRRSIVCASILGSMFLATVLAVDSTQAPDTQPGEPDEIVQFDAVIEQNYDYGRYHAVMFVRYWVCSEYYVCAVLWQEPHGLNHFQVQSFCCMSEKDRFRTFLERVKDDVYNRTFSKPISEPEKFQFIWGDYNVMNNRFSEQQSLDRRVYRADVASGLKSNPTGSFTATVSDSPGKHPRTLKQVKVQADAGRIRTLDLMDSNDQLMGHVAYTYEGSGTSLSRLTALLPETTLPVDCGEKGISGYIGGKRVVLKTLNLPYHRGGRACTVEYTPVRVGSRDVSLPKQVTVRQARDQSVLRTVRFMNYTHIQADRDTVWKQAKAFGAYDPDRIKAMAFVSKQSKRSPVEVKADSLDTLTRYRTLFTSQVNDANSAIGHRLRAMDSLMRLDPLIADWPAYEQHVRQYLAFLKAQDLDQTFMFGAVKPLQTLLADRRFQEADRIQKIWFEGSASCRAYDVYRLAKRLWEDRNFWLANQLIESYLMKNKDVDTSEAFCLRVRRCQALAGLLGALSPKSQIKNEALRGQYDWALRQFRSSVLKQKFLAGLSDAREFFKRLPAPVQESALHPYNEEVFMATKRPDLTRVDYAAMDLDRLLKSMQGPNQQSSSNRSTRSQEVPERLRSRGQRRSQRGVVPPKLPRKPGE